MLRWIGFVCAIVVGAVGGLYYGWVLDPIEYIDITPASLRVDYRSDYVLMVAEIYRVDESMPDTISRLSWISEKPAEELIKEAIDFGQQQGYSKTDLEAFRYLQQGLQAWNPMLGTLMP
jgi:hypothetical protein